MKANETPRQAESEIGKYFRFYIEKRPHRGLDRNTPYEVYYTAPINENEAA